MKALSGKPLPPQYWEVAAASVLLVWRAASFPARLLWFDWFTILCLLWIFTALGSRSRAWPAVAGLVMTGLLVLYGVRQLPLTLGVLRP